MKRTAEVIARGLTSESGKSAITLNFQLSFAADSARNWLGPSADRRWTILFSLIFLHIIPF